MIYTLLAVLLAGSTSFAQSPFRTFLGKTLFAEGPIYPVRTSVWVTPTSTMTIDSAEPLVAELWLDFGGGAVFHFKGQIWNAAHFVGESANDEIYNLEHRPKLGAECDLRDEQISCRGYVSNHDRPFQVSGVADYEKNFTPVPGPKLDVPHEVKFRGKVTRGLQGYNLDDEVELSLRHPPFGDARNLIWSEFSPESPESSGTFTLNADLKVRGETKMENLNLQLTDKGDLNGNKMMLGLVFCSKFHYLQTTAPFECIVNTPNGLGFLKFDPHMY